jgi:DNA phosphorothioation-dependent restriction protein DptH
MTSNLKSKIKNSMSGLQQLQDNQLTKALEELLLPRLREIIAGRSGGHCMRVADLDQNLMIALTRSLRREISQAQIFILNNHNQEQQDADLYISSTKLVELRNPLPDESLRPPLLVFLPSNLQTNAEDSFNVASFEDIYVADIYQELVQSLMEMERVPLQLQGYIKEIFKYLTKENWRWGDAVAQARFLLTAIANEIDGQVLGASLYELGLIPDLHLFTEPSTTTARISKNLESMRKLTLDYKSIRGRVLDLDLSEQSLQNRLLQFLVQVGVEEPQAWTSNIILNRNNWDMTFDKWKFKEELDTDKVFIEVLQTDLQEVRENNIENATNERLHSLIGSQILSPKIHKNFKVEFQVEPHPKQIQGLAYFTVQILNEDGGTVGTVKKVKIWNTKQAKKTVTLDKLDKFEFEEGWHFVRVLPWTENHNPIPLDEPALAAKITRTNPHQSQSFYVLTDADIEDEPPQRAIPQEMSLEHAKLRLKFTAISQKNDHKQIVAKDIIWIDKNTKNRGNIQEILEVKFGKDGKYCIPVSPYLKELEQTILASPQGTVSWKLEINNNQVSLPTEDITDFSQSEDTSNFLSSRSQYFAAIRNGEKNLISQAVDFNSLKDVCFDYAKAYHDLLINLCSKIENSDASDRQSFSELKKALAIDTVRVLITDFRGQQKEAILIGPTHPLRALWLVTWSQIAQSWLNACEDGQEEYISPVRDAILRNLLPLNVPPVQPLADGRVFLTVDNIHPFWSLYARSTEENTRGLLGEICTALGLPEATIGGAAITAEVLVSRIKRYLIQHPYIRTLTINAFNSGRTTVLAEALLALQKQDEFCYLRYDIRLFVPDPEAPGVGEAIEQLLKPIDSVNLENINAFSSTSGNHLFPKLNLAIHRWKDFYYSPQTYPAHLGLLFDVFPAEEIGAAPAFDVKEITPLHGLIQDFSIKFQDDASGTFWQRQPRHGKVIPLKGSESLVNLLADLPKIISGATATVATGRSAFNQRPVITLGLTPEQRELMHNIHQVCDWVFTIDRNIGIEFFDHGGRSQRPPYLVDYVPNATASFGHKLVVTSRSLSELESNLSQVLEKQYQIKLQANQATVILEQLRSLSGRLALKLLSSATQQSEAIGLALARLFLQYQGALSNQIIMPLDSHLELFRSAKQQAEELGSSTSLQRTDLALFDLNATTRTIRCNLVEIKCYKQVGGVSNFQQLKNKIAEQINQSQNVLRRHFEPTDRPDRLLKNREFSILLEFYLDRSLRYGIIEEDAAAEAKILLTTLEDGYQLDFSRSAIIFDFDKPGTELADYDQGIEFHRIGIDLINALLEWARPAQEIAQVSTGEITQEQKTEEVESAIPRLKSSVFIVQPRERSTSWDELENRQSEQPISINYASLDSSKIKHLEKVKNVNSETQLVEKEAEEVKPEPDFPQSVEIIKSNLEIIKPPQLELNYDTILGIESETPQYGILGETYGRKIALDLNQTHTISLFGVQGAGKSYTLGSIVEMACMPIPNINKLPSPLATVIFHYSPTQDYKPEFTSMVAANSDSKQIASLRERFGAEPAALKDVVILAPMSKVAERKAEYPDIEIVPLTFAASELKAAHWRFLMGAVGSQSMYLRQVNQIMRKLRDQITLEEILQGIENSSLSDHLKDLARTRLEFAGEYINDSSRLTNVIHPGRLIIVDLRDEYLEKDEALGLFVVLLQIFSEATYQGEQFNKLVVFDEAHKYIENPDLVAGLIEVVREMRHKGTSIMVASQDPPSVPISLIELSSQIIMHRFNSPAWLKHIQKANVALNNLTPENMSHLNAGEAYIWSSKATDDGFTRGAMKIRCRPRATQHGGSTKTAVNS